MSKSTVISLYVSILILGVSAAFSFISLRDVRADLAATRGQLVATSAVLAQARDVNDELNQRYVTLHAEAVQIADDRNDAIAQGFTLTAERDALLVTLNDSRAQHRRLSAAHSSLTSQHTQLQEEHGELTLRHRSLNSEHGALVQKHLDLQQTVGDVATMQRRLITLQDQVRPLVLAVNMQARGPFLCTGSMEPTITCLDAATWMSPPSPEHIGVGATISFDPDCTESVADGTGTAHRVTDIKTENGVTYFWPRGDGNREADGCWVPYSSVTAYIVDLHRGVYPENAELRNRVNSAYARFLQEEKKLEVVRQNAERASTEYREIIDGYCGAGVEPANCVLPPGQYAVALAAFNRLNTLLNEAERVYAVYEWAYDTWSCWYDSAEHSERPGHIPVNCALQVGPAPPPVFPSN